MKKLTLLTAAALVLALFSAGCGGKTETASGSTEESVTESAPGTSEPSTEEARVITAEDYSKLLSEDGYVLGLTAGDVFTVPEDWSEYAISKASIEPAGETIDAVLQQVMKQYPTKVTDRPIEKGDVVNMDYEGKLDGVAFSGGAAKGAELTAGSAEFVDNFLTKIIGRMPGETFDLEITFPDPYLNNPDLAGKLTIFTVTINYISGGAQEFTEEFVAENLDTLRTYFGAETAETKEDFLQHIRQYYLDRNLDTAIHEKFYGLDVEVPEAIYEYIYSMTDISVFNTYGFGIEKLAEVSNMSADELRTHVEQDCKPEIVFQAIAEKEGWTFRDADFAKELGVEDASALLTQYGANYIAHFLMTEKALNYLKENIPLTEEVETPSSDGQ